MKPGIKTTEFWVTLILAIIGPVLTILVVSGQLSPEGAEVVGDVAESAVPAIADAVSVIIANVTSLLAVRKYISARTELKTIE